MSKLDVIILDCINKALDQKQEKLGDYVDPTKEQLKDLMLELIDPDGPNWTTSEYDYLDYTKLTAAIGDL